MNRNELKKRCAQEMIRLLEGGGRLENIRVDKLCRAAGVSRAGFYRSFKDKYDLVVWIFNDILVSRVIHSSVVNDYLKSTILSLQIIRENQAFFEAILEYKGQNAFEEIYYQGLFEDAKTRLQDEIKAEFMAAGVVRVITEWLKSGCSLEPEKVAEKLDQFLEAIQGISDCR